MFGSAFLGRAAAILVFAWLAGRLLGATRLSWKTTVTAAVIGYAGSEVLVLAFGWSGGFLLALVFTMVAIVGIELLGRPGKPRLVLKPPLIPHPVRALRWSIQLMRRSAEITRIAVKHGLGPALGLSRRGDRDSDFGALARRGRDAMEEAGGTFVKLGQLLSTRVDLIPPLAAKEYAQLQEHVAPADPEAIRFLLETELERPVTEIFSEFEWEPTAAASIAQVHLARLHSGEPVVVKVQRPGVADTIERDLAILARLARGAENATAWGEAFGVSAFVADFSNGLREELDFRIEARNALEVAAAVAHLGEIHIPKMYDDVSTSRVLVMERLEGVSVGQTGRREVLGLEGEKLARLLLRAEMEPMFGGERFHADPHPGNVIILDDGRLGLVDLGATGRLDAFEQASIADMLVALGQRDPTLLREAAMEVATIRQRSDPHQLERALAQFMARHLSPGATPSAAMFNELMQVFLAFGIALPPTTTTMFRALVTLEGTLEALSPGFPIIKAAQDIATDLVRGRLAPQSLQEQAKEEILRTAPILQRLPRRLDRIATLIERGEIRIRVTDENHVEIAPLVNRAILALLGSALGLLSVILLGIPGGPLINDTISFFDVLGYIGLYIGVVLILRAALAALRDERG